MRDFFRFLYRSQAILASPFENFSVRIESIENRRGIFTIEEMDRLLNATGTRKPSRVNKPMAGIYTKAGVEPGVGLWEFRLNDSEGEGLDSGASIDVSVFSVGQKVDVTGTSIGKGFAGVIKRHNFSMQDATHGNSRSHRASGSIGQNQTPGRVVKGKRMAGHLGNVKRTAQNLEIVRVDAERNLLLIKGAIPGSKGGDVIVRSSVKARS